MTDLGNTYGNLTDYKKQEDLLERALEIKENYYIYDKIKVEEFSEGLKNLSSAYKDSGKSEKQIEILERALKIEEEQLSPESIEITDTLENLGLAYGDLKDWHKQKEFFERSLKIKEREYGSDSLEIIDVLEVLISLYRSLGDFKKQKELLEKSLSIQEKFCKIDSSLQERLFEDGCSLAVKILINLVYPHKDVAEYQKQCELFKEVLLELNKNYDDNNYEIIMAQVKISLAYGTLDNLIKEEEVFKKALNNLKDYDNEFITIIMKLVYNLSDTSEQINRILTIIDKYHPDLAQKTILSLYQAKELCTPKSNLTSEVLIAEKVNTQTHVI